VEGVDHPGFDPRDLALPPDSALEARHEPGLLGGVVALTGEGVYDPPSGWENCLYRASPAGEGQPAPAVAGRTVPLKAVPYYAWANREPGAMQVWIRGR
jgi:DUF1680 family protein